MKNEKKTTKKPYKEIRSIGDLRKRYKVLKDKEVYDKGKKSYDKGKEKYARGKNSY